MEKVIHKKLETLDDEFYQRLKTDCLKVIETVGWNDGVNQIMLQTTDPNIDDYLTGTGSLSKAVNKFEPNYRYIQPSLRGTALDELFTDLGVFRSRLMLSKTRTCYSIHKDVTTRLHIALDTNEQAIFLFPDQNQMFHIPEDKSIHYVDTTKNHSFANCGIYDRVHLVMCSRTSY